MTLVLGWAGVPRLCMNSVLFMSEMWAWPHFKQTNKQTRVKYRKAEEKRISSRWPLCVVEKEPRGNPIKSPVGWHGIQVVLKLLWGSVLGVSPSQLHLRCPSSFNLLVALARRKPAFTDTWCQQTLFAFRATEGCAMTCSTLEKWLFFLPLNRALVSYRVPVLPSKCFSLPCVIQLVSLFLFVSNY